MIEPLLEAENLRVTLRSSRGRDPITVVRDVSLYLAPGEGLGVVGESGSGKSMTVRAIMRLLPDGGRVTGELRYRGEDVLRMDSRRLASYRGRDVGMIFQDPRAHINPLWTIGKFLTEAVIARREVGQAEADARAIELLHEVGIDDGSRRMHQYPHQLSGGLLQRIMIVATLMDQPKLILADEITTALDVTVQSEVMAILSELRAKKNLGLLMITHDLDLAAAVTDRLAVMYAGSIVESGSSEAVTTRPRHPYTAGLLASRPRTDEVRRLKVIPGRPVSAVEAGEGCPFAPRCAFALPRCRAERPLLRPVDDRLVACHRAEDVADKLREEVAA
jgi:peptide/nickel transport system ATP-binding protein